MEPPKETQQPEQSEQPAQNPASPTNNPQPAPQQPTTPEKTSALSVVGLILAVLFPPVGLILSIIAWRITSKNHEKGKSLAIAGVIVSVVFILGEVLIIYLLNSVTSTISGTNHPNQAKEDLQPVVSQIEKLGGTKICDKGDSGHSLDNTIPSYIAYYKAPDKGLAQGIYQAGANAGFKIAPVNENTYQQQPNYSFIDRTGGKSLTITIVRSGSLPLQCGADHWNEPVYATNSNDIVHLDLRLPEVQR